MLYIEALDLKQIIGPVGAENAGHGITYEVSHGANIQGATVSVDLKLNEKSLHDARGRVEHEQSAEVLRAAGPDVPKPSAAIDRINDKAQNLDIRYAKQVKLCGFGKHPNYRIAMTREHQLGTKSPLVRTQVRRLHEVRALFNQIASRKQATTTIPADKMPQPLIKKLAEEALAKGLHQTPVGTLVQTMKMAGMKPKAKQWAMIDPHLIPTGFATH